MYQNNEKNNPLKIYFASSYLIAKKIVAYPGVKITIALTFGMKFDDN